MKIINRILILLILPILSLKGYSQDSKTVMRLGIYAAETNNLYVDDRGSIEHWAPYLYLAPAFQIGRHEIYAGINYPLREAETLSNVKNGGIPAKYGASVGYKVFMFKPTQRVNLFFQYSFNYFHYRGPGFGGSMGSSWDTFEDQKLYNHELGYGMSVYLDKKNRVGLFFSQRYILGCFDYYITHYYLSGSTLSQTDKFFNSFNLSLGLHVAFYQFSVKHGASKKEAVH